MTTKKSFFQLMLICLVIVTALACSLTSTPVSEQPDSSAMETEIAFRMLSTTVANQQLTLQALQAQVTQQPLAEQPTQPPIQNSPTPDVQPSPVPTQTLVPTPTELVLEIRTSVDTFYCYQSPYELIITVEVSDINRGMAVYYHIEDKYTGTTSDQQVIDLHRRTGNTRDAKIIGGGSMQQNLQFPPLMNESYFIYQIISDDAVYRSLVFSDITFFPCAQ